MDDGQLAAIHEALVAVQQAVTTMTFPSCDQEMCTFLNSIARSLRAQPEAREACLTIEDAIGAAGMPSTWQSGI
jgi:hypothetical protein